MRLFADDCVVYRETNDQHDHQQIQSDLDHLSSWAERWQLNFNVSKCYHLRITNKKTSHSFCYSINGHAISSVHSVKYLGVTIADNVSWNEHCDIMCRKANSTLGLLRRISSKPKHIKPLSARNSNMQDVHGIPTRNEILTRSNLSSIEQQDFVFHDYSRFSHVTPMINSLGWNSLEQRRLLQQSTMFFKIHQGLVGIMFPNEVHPLNRKSQLPNPYPYRQLQCNNNIYKYSFYPRTIVTWNNLHLTPFPNMLSSFKTSATPAL